MSYPCGVKTCDIPGWTDADVREDKRLDSLHEFQDMVTANTCSRFLTDFIYDLMESNPDVMADVIERIMGDFHMALRAHGWGWEHYMDFLEKKHTEGDTDE